jgi:hypothetical protein
LEAEIPPIIEKFNPIEINIKSLEEDVEELKKRPVADATGKAEFDLSDVWLSNKWKDLVKRLELVERRNAEQDERLTDNEQRL